MPEAVAITVAKALTAQIAATATAGDFSQEFTPERGYGDWHYELKDEDLHVDVILVTNKQETELHSRGNLSYRIPVDIAVRKKFGIETQDDDTGRVDVAKVDELMLLVEEINELMMPTRLPDYLQGVWMDTSILVAPLYGHLRHCRQFTGIVRVTFLVPKALT